MNIRNQNRMKMKQHSLFLKPKIRNKPKLKMPRLFLNKIQALKQMLRT